MIALQKSLRGMHRCAQPGEPVPSRSGKYISDVMLSNVILTCPEGLARLTGEGLGATPTEL